MFSNTGALVDTETDVNPEPEKELTILSCGHYRLLRLEKLHTVRIQGCFIKLRRFAMADSSLTVSGK